MILNPKTNNPEGWMDYYINRINKDLEHKKMNFQQAESQFKNS